MTSAEIDAIYRTQIREVLFIQPVNNETQPVLVLLGGQPGSGVSRASARLLVEHDGMVDLRGEDLRIFHPHYRELVTSEPHTASATFAEATRRWVRAAIEDALTGRRSLLLEGTFSDPDIALATAAKFREAGFHVRIVAVASPRVLSVVTCASRYLRDRKMKGAGRFTSLTAHDRAYEGTRRLIDLLGSTAGTDRLTILSRAGMTLFDQTRGENGVDTLGDGRRALADGRSPETWGARSTMELLGELKQITTYAISSGELRPDVAELLIEAHTLALTDVVPRLSVEAQSPQARFTEKAVTEQLVALLRATPQPDPPADVPGVEMNPGRTAPPAPTLA
jgi:UDP-N-acetylglucosamine kinase